MAAIVGASALSAPADIVYQDNFDGAAGDIAGRALTVASGLAGGTAGVTWTSTASSTNTPTISTTTSDAVFGTSGGTHTGVGTTFASVGTFGTGADANLITNAYVPFVPVAGFLYDAHLSIASSGVGASGNWLGMAFTANGTTGPLNNHTPSGSASALSNDNSFGLILIKGSGAVQTFAGLGTANAVVNTAVGSNPVGTTTPIYTDVDVLLDTTGTAWKMTWELGGTVAGTFTYTTNPTNITDLAFGSNKLTGAVSDFSLTATGAPEPASLGLLAIGAVGMLARRRR
jgi:hypothetical protein